MSSRLKESLVPKRRPTSPGALLRLDYLEPRGLSITRLAAAIGCSRKHMSGIVNGHVRLEPVMAARLGKVLGTSSAFWLNLQSNLDVWEAEQENRRWKPLEVFAA
ncbi:MAG: HigA family addiction module antitoxin [Rhodospirillales bacterium]|nr:HigA family addiction module antitoxin [Rhodospirillales bacterium]